MVIIIVPLSAILSLRRVGGGIEETRLIGIVLDNEMNDPSGRSRKFSDRPA